MSSLSDVKNRAICIQDYADELMNAYEELRGDYLDVSQERDELLERVKERESKDDN